MSSVIEPTARNGSLKFNVEQLARDRNYIRDQGECNLFAKGFCALCRSRRAGSDHHADLRALIAADSGAH
jgi:hypothetical protein